MTFETLCEHHRLCESWSNHRTVAKGGAPTRKAQKKISQSALVGQTRDREQRAMTDERIEAFLRDVFNSEGTNPNEIREATRIYLAEYERMFRDDEWDERKEEPGR
jgi:hypothetical protein